MYRHILLPMDGSEVAVRAARTGIDLAAVHGARVTLLTCSVPYASFAADALLELQRSQYDEIARAAAARTLAAGEDYAKQKGMPATLEHLFAAHPHEAIVRTAGELGCDLIVMGTHGRRSLAATMLGSQTLKVLAHSSIPVLVCR